jgi:hypothetical protein
MSDLATLSIVVDSSPLNEATKAADRLTAAGENAAKMASMLVAALGLYEFSGYIKEATILAARFETMGVVMHTAGLNAGFAAVQMDALEVSLRKTGISMLESRNILAQMSGAQMDLTKSSALARAAQDLAVVGGINSSEAFGRMVQAIVSAQPKILRTMGLNVSFEQGYQKLADTLGKTVEQLSEQEQMQSRVNTVLANSAGYAGIYEASMTTAGKQMLSMQRYSEDLQVKFGAVFSPALSALVQGATAGLKGMADAIGRASANGSLQSVAGALGRIAGSGVETIGDTVAFIVKHIEALQNILIAAGIAAAYAWGPAGLAGLSNIVGPLISSLVGLWGAITADTIALTLFNGALAVLTSPITAIIAGVTLVVGTFMFFHDAIYGSMDDIEEYTKKLDAQNGQMKTWLTMREDVVKIEKQIKALKDDGGQAGPANRQNRIDDMVKTATKDKTFDPQELASVVLYATKLVDAQIALASVKKGQDDKAAADQKAREATKAAATAIAEQNTTLEREHILLTKGALAAYAYDLAQEKIPSRSAAILVAKHQENDALKEDQEARDKGIAGLLKEADAHTSLMNTLNPVAKQAHDYADAIALINQYTADGPERINALKAAYDTMTPSGIAAAAATKKIADEVARLNQRNTPEDQLAHTNVLRGAGLSDEAYAHEMAKNQQLRLEFMRLKAEGGNTWAILGYAMTQASSNSTDAMVRWMDNLDGVGRSWHTLGSTVRSVISDMLIQMQRAVIQQKLMNPLMQWAGLAIGGLTGGGAGPDMTNQMGNGSYVGYNGQPLFGYAVGTDYVPQTGLALLHQGEAVVPAAENRYGARGGGGMTVTNQISVTVTGSGANASVPSRGSNGQAIGDSLKGLMTQWAIEEKRPGGVLNPA